MDCVCAIAHSLARLQPPAPADPVLALFLVFALHCVPHRSSHEGVPLLLSHDYSLPDHQSEHDRNIVPPLSARNRVGAIRCVGVLCRVVGTRLVQRHSDGRVLGVHDNERRRLRRHSTQFYVRRGHRHHVLSVRRPLHRPRRTDYQQQLPPVLRAHVAAAGPPETRQLDLRSDEDGGGETEDLLGGTRDVEAAESETRSGRVELLVHVARTRRPEPVHRHARDAVAHARV